MGYVFISYAHVDADFTELLRINLEKSGYEVWIDTDRLKAGEDWRQGIDDAIQFAACLVVIISPEAMSSAYVTYEWAFAFGRKVPLVPVVYRSTKLHPRIESLQYLDFTHRKLRPWQELNKRVGEFL